MKKSTLVLSVMLLSFILGSSAAVAKPKGKGEAKAKAPPAEAVKPEGINHIVRRPDETLFSIAEKYYGDGYRSVQLLEYNPFVDNPDRLNVGETIFVPDAKNLPADSETSSQDPGGTRFSPFAWLPEMPGIIFFGRTLPQILLLVLAWFVGHLSLQGLMVWFAAHLSFVKDVNLKKAMRATLQLESLALVSVLMMALVGLTLLYVGTTSPGKPLTAELLTTAEDYLRSPSGMGICGFLLLLLYGFLGVRFIPQAFGVERGRGFTLVTLGILIPHLVFLYLVGHRMGIIG